MQSKLRVLTTLQLVKIHLLVMGRTLFHSYTVTLKTVRVYAKLACRTKAVNPG